jgi:hypothetical protein
MNGNNGGAGRAFMGNDEWCGEELTCSLAINTGPEMQVSLAQNLASIDF